MIIIHFDGGITGGNPGGKIVYGFLVLDENNNQIYNETAKEEAHESTSNNVAEYKGLILALNYIIDNNITDDIIIKGDSQLVIKQMSKIWKIHNGLYKNVAYKALTLVNALPNIQFVWVSRKLNTEIDSLIKQ